MLYFANRPDPAFQAIVRGALESAIDDLKDTENEDVLSLFYPETRRCFDRSILLRECQRLLDAHVSPALFQVTDYHFLILEDTVSRIVEQHNEEYKDEGEHPYISLSLRHIDMPAIQDAYFWDMDFLLSPDDYDNIPPASKNCMRFSKELFGVVHGLRPHDEELTITEIPVSENWREPEGFYQPREDYPADIHPDA